MFMRRRPIFVFLSFIACSASPAPHRAQTAAAATAIIPARAPVTVTEPLFKGLGAFHRSVTTKSPEAQQYFDQGLAFLYAFNHDEAIRSFKQAAAFDPDCAMAHWGVALANGPHINASEVDDAHNKEALDALARAKAAQATPIERAMIDALQPRYAPAAPHDRKPLDEAYAQSMRALYSKYPEDSDIGALFAESMMNLRPWDLWTADGQPEPGTEEIVKTLETVLARTPNHPFANHLYIHAVEASPHPERADAAAERLRAMQPGLGHMVHMPSHIDVRRGRWRLAEEANDRALETEADYLKLAAPPKFYAFYIVHDYDMLAYAATMAGESKRAIRAARGMIAAIPKEAFADPHSVRAIDRDLATPLEVLVRFGKWDDVLSEPVVPGDFPVSHALRHAARATAYAAEGRVYDAQMELRDFVAAKKEIDKDDRVSKDARQALPIPEHLVAGEIYLRENDIDRAIAEMSEAVKYEDTLPYDEPPVWILPPRHPLGVTLLKAHKAKEAEAVYREDLKRHPDNGWSLIGLARSLRVQGKDADATDAEQKFQRAWGTADIKLSSSCLCEPGD